MTENAVASPKDLPKLLLYPDKLRSLPVLWKLATVYSPEISVSLSIRRPRKYDDLATIIECTWRGYVLCKRRIECVEESEI